MTELADRGTTGPRLWCSPSSWGRRSARRDGRPAPAGVLCAERVTCTLAALALTFILPVEGHSQAKTTPKCSDQGDLFGRLSLGRDCSVTLMVGQAGSGPEADFDFWAYWDGSLDRDDQILEVRVDGASVKEQGRNATKPTVSMLMSSRQTFGVYVRSAEHEDNAAFRWAVTDRDREIVRTHFPHCAP